MSFAIYRLRQHGLKKHHAPATYVGHPFFDSIAGQPMDTRFIQHWRQNNRIQIEPRRLAPETMK